MKIVVKVGGAFEGDIDDLARSLAKATLETGTQIIVVHGGSTDAATVLQRLGIPQERLTAPDGMTTRYTTAPVLEGLIMALRGLTQTRLVRALLRAGLQPVGLSGVDGRLAEAKRKSAIRAVADGRTRVVRDNLAGSLTEINVTLLQLLLQHGYLPVVCPPAITKAHDVVNVDADRLAAEVAIHWQADALLLLTAVEGLRDEEGLLVDALEARTTEDLPSYVNGGMRMKVHAAARAATHGVPHVVIAHAGHPDVIDNALQGNGTRVVNHALR